ncbi:MAG: hypothetical protein COU67_01300 [Candidatus Pacebacteria bacterium CG10_big_fil_rev_8_21_14_0_10_44_54]|nr:MAG: hypothetical protein COU67_01300 [Candidatus Pacebacteria bacterium CG10_big_fil_rev_8_21_14_0_10_44_54]
MNTLRTGFDTERFRKECLARGDLAQLAKTYDGTFSEIQNGNSPQFWEAKFVDTESETFPMAQDRNQTIVSLLQPNTKVLNLGSGKGFLEALVWQKFANKIDFTGTDFTKRSLARLAKLYPNYNFLHANLLQLPFKKKSFDCACLIEVLEHISASQTFGVLSELHRVVQQNGRVFLSVPINEDLEEMMPHNPNEHVRVYSEELLRYELETAGFSVEKVYRFSAFNSLYRLKKIVNQVLNLRQPNNLLLVLRK